MAVYTASQWIMADILSRKCSQTISFHFCSASLSTKLPDIPTRILSSFFHFLEETSLALHETSDPRIGVQAFPFLPLQRQPASLGLPFSDIPPFHTNKDNVES